MHQGVTWDDWSNNKNVTLGGGRRRALHKLVRFRSCIRQQKWRRSRAEPRATLSKKKKRSHEKTPLLSLLLALSLIQVCFISLLTRVALSKGVRAVCTGVWLPSLRGIVCRSSNASFGSLIKRNVKEKKTRRGGQNGRKGQSVSS